MKKQKKQLKNKTKKVKKTNKNQKGEKQKLVRVVTKMHEAKFPLEQIAAIAEISVENVKEIID